MTPEQLRASILQYAIEGKLVKQNPSDAPASKLLKKIENEKVELIKEGKIKRSRKLPVITDDEKPFDIPDNWEWVRLNDISQQIGDIDHKMPTKVNFKSIPYISPKDFTPTGIDYQNAKQIDEKSFLQLSKKFKPQKGDFIFPRYGTIGKIREIDVDFPLLVSYSCCVIRPSLNVERKYVYYGLQSKVIKDEINRYINKSTQPNVGLKSIQSFIFPLPPLEEQKRIVAKIKKLMPLVDEYAESYNRLQKIDNEFEDKLKQSVLQYAMEGKLVKQNLSDEPASELIKKIENEKAELVKEGKIKKSKKLPAITDDEKPFDIPDSWEWVRLKQITTYGNFNSIKGSSIPDNSWVVDMKDVRKNGGGFSEIVRRKSTDIYKSNKYSFNKNAVLYGKLRPYLRKVEIAQTSGFTTTEMLPINVVDLSTLVPQYLRYAMLSPYFVNLVNDSMYGMKMPRVGTTFLAKMVVPLPPLEEQKRIVEKVEELQSSISNLSK